MPVSDSSGESSNSKEISKVISAVIRIKKSPNLAFRLSSIVFYVAHHAATGIFMALFVHLTHEYWSAFATWTRLSDRMLFVFSTALLHILLWLSNFIFVAADKMVPPFSGLARWKIKRPPATGQVPPDELLWKSITEVGFWLCTVQFGMLFVIFEISSWMGMRFSGPPTSFKRMAFEGFLAFFVNDFLFYISHRIFHTRTFYSFHKQHHEFRASTGFAAEYTNPLSAVGTQIPGLFDPLYIGSHIYLWIVYVAVRILRTNLSHCGYAIPFIMTDIVTHHDAHHSRNVGNFAETPLWDLICNTCDARWQEEAEAQWQAARWV